MLEDWEASWVVDSPLSMAVCLSPWCFTTSTGGDGTSRFGMPQRMGRNKRQEEGKARSAGMTRWNSRLLMLFHLLVLNHPLLYPQIMPHTLCLICVWSSSELCPCLECAIHSFLHPHFATPQGQSQVFKFPLTWLTPPCPALLSLCSPRLSVPLPPHQ